MKLIYLIVIHKNLEQVNKLIDSIFCDKVGIYVHIDKKSKINPKDINPKAKVIERRVSVVWADFSQVQATLNSIEEINQKEQDYSHICLISGQDYPIKSNDAILKNIEEDKDYLEHIKLDEHTKWTHRFEGWYYTRGSKFLGNLSWRLTRYINKYLHVKRKQLPNIKTYYGSNWFILSKASIQFILDFVADKQNKQFVNFFKKIPYVDEHFFHCILLNQNKTDSIINDNLRYILLEPGKINPEILTIKNYDNIIQSNKLFCRKIDFPQSKELIDKLDLYRNKEI